jgi:choline dehydrogenase-like flavoprotein
MMPIINALKVDSSSLLQADVCIIGAGAAGIAIAREFIGTPYQVLLLESGDFEYDEATQSLYQVKNVGHPLRMDKGYVSRNRYFGGSTNTWAGRCIPLNDIDFQARSWVADSGWPFTKETLEPFYQRAAAVLRLPTYSLFTPHAWPAKILEHQPGFLMQDEIATPEVALYAHSPLKMGRVYQRELLEASNLQICLHANVTEIEPHPDHKQVQQLWVKTLRGNQFRVQSRAYILACGGWENARLLLQSQRHSPQGVGNVYDLVGRYYMEHPKIYCGRLYPTAKTLRSPIFLEPIRTHHGFAQLGIRLTDQQQQQAQVLNHHIELLPGYPAGMPEARQAFQWVGSSVKRLRWHAIRAQDVQTFMPHLSNLADYSLRRRFNRPIPYPYISILNHLEQVPYRESRVTLDSQLDALGQNLLQVQLRITRQEKESLARFHQILDQHLQIQGMGRLVSDMPDIDNPWEALTDSK